MCESWPPANDLYCCVCRDFRSLLEVTRHCSPVMVDIPIGLPTGDEPRICDIRAQEELGKEGRARVFVTPPRETLTARSAQEFQDVYKELRHVGAGYPVWGIVPKLLEVDSQMNPELQKRVREFHPELTWKRIGGEVLPSKHCRAGIEARVELLGKLFPEVGSSIAWAASLGRAARLDDLLDAIVGLSVADGVQREGGPQFRLPEGEPPEDERGLRMEMWY